MADEAKHCRNKATSGSRSKANERSGGNPARQAEKWGGGTKAAKGPVTSGDKRNPQSSSKT